MHNVDGGAVARISVGGVRLSRGEGLGGKLREALRRFEHRLGRAHARRTARRDLYRLDDRLLQDIGLRRDQVDEFVDSMFRKEKIVAVKRPGDA